MQSLLRYQRKRLQRQTIASITIRALNEPLKNRLHIRAAEHGHSMEEEAREILHQAVGTTHPVKDLGRAIHERFAAIAMHNTPDFDGCGVNVTYP